MVQQAGWVKCSHAVSIAMLQDVVETEIETINSGCNVTESLWTVSPQDNGSVSVSWPMPWGVPELHPNALDGAIVRIDCTFLPAYPDEAPKVRVCHCGWWVPHALRRHLSHSLVDYPGCQVLYLLYTEAETWLDTHQPTPIRDLPAPVMQRVVAYLPERDRLAACTAFDGSHLLPAPPSSPSPVAPDGDQQEDAVPAQDMADVGIDPLVDLLVLSSSRIRQTDSFKKHCKLTTRPMSIGEAQCALAVCVTEVAGAFGRVVRVHNEQELCRLIPLAHVFELRQRPHLHGAMPFDLRRMSGAQLWKTIQDKLLPQHLRHRDGHK